MLVRLAYVVISAGQIIFLLAMINERQRKFCAMRVLGANPGYLRRFLFAEAAIIGRLSLVTGTVIGFGVARLLVLLHGVIFRMLKAMLDIPWLKLALLDALVVLGMRLSTGLSSRRLAPSHVIKGLREL